MTPSALASIVSRLPAALQPVDANDHIGNELGGVVNAALVSVNRTQPTHGDLCAQLLVDQRP